MNAIKIKNSFSAPLLAFAVYLLLIISGTEWAAELIGADNPYLSSVILQLLIFALPGIFYIRLKKTGYAGKLNLRTYGFNALPTVLLMTGLILVGNAMLRLILYHLGAYSAGTASGAGAMSGGGILYVLVTFALLPALTEEFLFRGIIFTEYNEGGCSGFTAVFMSAVLFAFSHFNGTDLPIYIFDGMVLALTVYVTRSVFASMTVHLVNNIFALFFESSIFKLIAAPDNMVLVVFVMITLFLILLFFALGEAERLYYMYGVRGQQSPEYINEERESRFPPFVEAVISPSFIVCVITFVTVLLLQSVS